MIIYDSEKKCLNEYNMKISEWSSNIKEKSLDKEKI